MKYLLEKIKALSLYFVTHHLWFIFIITGMLQMIIGRWIGVHDGLEHMIFNHWWEYVCEGLLYSLCHVGIYYWLIDNN